MVKAPIFQGAIKLRNVLDCQAKILEAVMDRRQCPTSTISVIPILRQKNAASARCVAHKPHRKIETPRSDEQCQEAEFMYIFLHILQRNLSRHLFNGCVKFSSKNSLMR